MRVSGLVAIASLFACYAHAEEVLRGRNLKDGNKEDSRSNYYTEKFNLREETHGPEDTFEDGYQIGVILGFIVTASFMIFGVITIIWDEINRHKRFKEQVRKDESRLRNDHNCSEETMRLYR